MRAATLNAEPPMRNVVPLFCSWFLGLIDAVSLATVPVGVEATVVLLEDDVKAWLGSSCTLLATISIPMPLAVLFFFSSSRSFQAGNGLSDSVGEVEALAGNEVWSTAAEEAEEVPLAADCCVRHVGVFVAFSTS